MHRVISECIVGKERHFPGDVLSDLTPDQAERLTTAGCIEVVEEQAPPPPPEPEAEARSRRRGR